MKERENSENPFTETPENDLMRENAHHSTTLETCMAQVGKERALEGSLSCKDPHNGNSAAEAGPIRVRVRVRPAPRKPRVPF